MPLTPPISLHEVAESRARELGPWKDETERAAAQAAPDMESRIGRLIFHARDRLSKQDKPK